MGRTLQFDLTLLFQQYLVYSYQVQVLKHRHLGFVQLEPVVVLVLVLVVVHLVQNILLVCRKDHLQNLLI